MRVRHGDIPPAVTRQQCRSDMWGCRETGWGAPPPALIGRSKPAPDSNRIMMAIRQSTVPIGNNQLASFDEQEAGRPSINESNETFLWTPKVSTAHPSNRILYPEPAYFNAARGYGNALVFYPQSAVNRINASRYFSIVWRMTFSGNAGAGGFLFQSCVSSQSRTNCLS